MVYSWETLGNHQPSINCCSLPCLENLEAMHQNCHLHPSTMSDGSCMLLHVDHIAAFYLYTSNRLMLSIQFYSNLAKNHNWLP